MESDVQGVTTTEQSFYCSPPGDFFSSVKAYMGVDESFKQLGWKLRNERRGDPPHRLSDDCDYRMAFDAGRAAQRNLGTGQKFRHAVEVHNTVSEGVLLLGCIGLPIKFRLSSEKA